MLLFGHRLTPSRFFLGLIILLMTLSLGLLWLTRPQGIRTPAPNRGPVPFNIANLDIITTEGRRFPLAPMQGGVVLVISAGCVHCHALLARLKTAEAQSGPLTRLTIVSLEGATPGLALLRQMGPHAPVVGPGLPVKEFAKQLGLTATPMLLFITPQGRIRIYETGLTEKTWPRWIQLMRSTSPLPAL